ncbi:histidine kinase, partial [bacterium M00.F.Ca.ET.228.01.1.1]
DLLVNAEWRGATVAELVEAQVRVFAAQSRLSAKGPVIMLKPNAVQYLGIAFHELATNSAKYGVLSNPVGQVESEWAITTAANGEETFGLVWHEH